MFCPYVQEEENLNEEGDFSKSTSINDSLVVETDEVNYEIN